MRTEQTLMSSSGQGRLPISSLAVIRYFLLGVLTNYYGFQFWKHKFATEIWKHKHAMTANLWVKLQIKLQAGNDVSSPSREQNFDEAGMARLMAPVGGCRYRVGRRTSTGTPVARLELSASQCGSSGGNSQSTILKELRC
jgi:hypothetical protein